MKHLGKLIESAAVSAAVHWAFQDVIHAWCAKRGYCCPWCNLMNRMGM